MHLRILVWPICQSGFILHHLCIFQLRGLSSTLFDAHMPPITGLRHTWFPLMLHSSASLPLTTTSHLSSSATSSENCPRLPCSVSSALASSAIASPLWSLAGVQKQGSRGFGWGLAGYYVPLIHSVQVSCIILGSYRLPKSCLSKALYLEGW